MFAPFCLRAGRTFGAPAAGTPICEDVAWSVRDWSCLMAKYALAALALLVALHASLPAMAAQGGGRAKSCREQCDKRPCEASRAVCRQWREACLAECKE